MPLTIYQHLNALAYIYVHMYVYIYIVYQQTGQQGVYLLINVTNTLAFNI